MVLPKGVVYHIDFDDTHVGITLNLFFSSINLKRFMMCMEKWVSILKDRIVNNPTVCKSNPFLVFFFK